MTDATYSGGMPLPQGINPDQQAAAIQLLKQRLLAAQQPAQQQAPVMTGPNPQAAQQQPFTGMASQVAQLGQGGNRAAPPMQAAMANSGDVTGAATGDNPIARAREAIAGQESADWASRHGDNGYGALGPTTRSGDFAVGRYQMMRSNIPEWTKQTFGTPMNWQDFRASPQAQDAVFNNIFGGYLNKYGPAGAAHHWFGMGRSDGYHTADQYVGGFMNSFGGGGSGAAAPETASAGPSGTMQSVLSKITGSGAEGQMNAPTSPLMAPGGPLAGVHQAVSAIPTGQGSMIGGMMGSPSFGNRMQQAAAWLLAANNPSGAAGMLNAVNSGAMNPVNAQLAQLKAQQMFAPQFGPVGTDLLGHPQYGMQPSGMAAMYGGQGAPTGGGGMSLAGQGSAMMNSGQDLPGMQGIKANPNATMAQKLQQVPAVFQPEVQAALNYQAMPGTLRGASSMPGFITSQYAHAIDPTYNESPAVMDYIKKMGDTSTTNSAGGQRLAAQNLIDQLYTATSAALRLGNTAGPNIPGGSLLGATYNNIKNSSPEHAEDKNNLDTAAQYASGEVGKLSYGSTGGGEQERQASARRWGSANSPGQIAGAASADVDILEARLKALEAQRDAVVPGSLRNDPRVDFTPPQYQEKLAQIKQNIASLRQQQSGGKAASGDVTGRDQYKEGQTATNPKTKERMIFKGGSWQAM